MPIVIVAAWTFVKAWALPFLAPIAGKAVFLAASARSWMPRGVGTTVFALGVAAFLGLLLWARVSLWLDPPPRTFTAAEIQAAYFKTQLEETRKALAFREAADAKRSEFHLKLAGEHHQQTKELELELEKTRSPDGVAVDADDPWLRSWHRRGW